MADHYEIKVVRRGKSGTLTFSNGTINVSETCWWDPEVVIDAGTYTGYATRMANKTDGTDGGKREGIWLGRGVPYNNGQSKSNGIFIHKGVDASWSDGCIVLRASKVYEIWSSISPKESPNVTVRVEDEDLKRGRALNHECTNWPSGRWMVRGGRGRFVFTDQGGW